MTGRKRHDTPSPSHERRGRHDTPSPPRSLAERAPHRSQQREALHKRPRSRSVSPRRFTDDRASSKRHRSSDKEDGEYSGSGSGESKPRKKRKEGKKRKRQKHKAKKKSGSRSDRPHKNAIKKCKAGTQKSEGYDSSSSGSGSCNNGFTGGKEDGESVGGATAAANAEVAAEPTSANGDATRARTASSSEVDEDAPTPTGSPVRQTNADGTASTATQPNADAFPSTAAVGAAKGDRGIDETAMCVDEDAPTPPASPRAPRQTVEVSVNTAVGKNSFFAQLLAVEQKKGTIGTIHATGNSGGGAGGGGSGGGPIQSSDWECLKCGKSNYKNASACDRCHALKRMTLWRD